MKKFKKLKLHAIPSIIAVIFIAVLFAIPPKYEYKVVNDTERVQAVVLETNDSGVINAGIIKFGDQICKVRLISGKHKGVEKDAVNSLRGSLEYDKFYNIGDKALVVVDFTEDGVSFITMVDHYRLNIEIALIALFCIILVLFAGATGIRAILSFILTVLIIWKIFIPYILTGYDPVLVGVLTVSAVMTMVITLIMGYCRKSLTAILGSLAGMAVTCAIGVIFIKLLKIHGAVMGGAETLLYSGFDHLNLTKIFTASIFLAASGAIMDVAVDIAASIAEVVEAKPDISRKDAIKAGFNVGRAVIGTMTTTLLLAYSGSYIALMMVYVGHGTPIINIINFKYISAEFLHTFAGSFGLITVAPLTAVFGGLLLTNRHKNSDSEQKKKKKK